MKHFVQKKTGFAAILTVLFLLSVLFSSCAPAEGPYEGKDAVRFTDALGREVAVARNLERVAALLGSFADVWMLSGGTLCAAADDAWEDFGLTLKDAINLGGAHSPSLERLLASDPDLVLASASTASNVDMRDVLEAAGITVAYFDVDNFDDYLPMLAVCTEITGRKDLYERNGLAIQAQIEAIKAQYEDAALPPEERTVLLLRASSSAVKAREVGERSSAKCFRTWAVSTSPITTPTCWKLSAWRR